jgi:hypothetical protein
LSLLEQQVERVLQGEQVVQVEKGMLVGLLVQVEMGWLASAFQLKESLLHFAFPNVAKLMCSAESMFGCQSTSDDSFPLIC